MAKRSFELPGIQDLGKDQEAARALPKEGQHLIIGGPGTGKSVLALLRAGRHQRERDNYLVLVFNHLLDRASGQLFGDGLESRTWIGWFLETFARLTSQPVPRSASEGKRFREIDWDGVAEIIQELPKEGSGPRPFLVIDEGQDMPRAFYTALANLGFDRFFVVADQNQQITDANSSRKDIQDCLGLGSDKVIELRQNYRNRYRVARLAREFHTRDPASPPPELPKRASGGAVPLLYRYDERQIEAVARGILRLADQDPRQLVGVLAPNNRVRERYLEALRSTQVRLDNPRPAIATYHMGERSEVSFDEGGILVINAQACKGLEFDIVVLADIDEHIVRKDPDVTRRLFYVMVARARERVLLFMKRGCGGEIEKLLPTDPEVLRRKENL